MNTDSTKSSLALSPDEQVSNLMERASRQRRKVDLSQIPDVPTFTPQTDTEALLLHQVLPRRSGVSATTRTFTSLWSEIQGDNMLNLDPSTLFDTVGTEPKPGFRWVAFNPCWKIIDEERDFRANVYVDHDDRERSSSPYQRIGSTKVAALAGLEVFTALAVMPAFMKEAWSEGREHALRPVLPRLAASGSYSQPGNVDLNVWQNGRINCFTSRWNSNYYGHFWVIPGIRELGSDQ